FLLEERIVLIELAREPGPPRFVMGPRLSHWDWLAVGDPEVGDLDADGIPEALFRAGFGGLASCWGMTGDDCYCSVPATQALRVGREDHAPALAVGGGHTDPAILERARAELDAVSSSGPPEQCPAFTPRWVHWKPVGQPRFGRIDGGYAMDLVVDRRECRGWLDAEEEVFGACRGRTRISIRHEVRGTQVETTERPYTPTSIVADADARLLVVPWHLYDGDPRPHPLPVTIGSREGGRARRTGRGARGLTLDPGFYLVEVRRGTNRITYQVAIAPGDANVHLASPAEARP
ncbi:MAG: hypothetical protein H5U40_17340, partial [Polyangiaceae bacterium]|nr:hypothetical protein [Polyangiaceae bacterium]